MMFIYIKSFLIFCYNDVASLNVLYNKKKMGAVRCAEMSHFKCCGGSIHHVVR